LFIAREGQEEELARRNANTTEEAVLMAAHLFGEPAPKLQVPHTLDFLPCEMSRHRADGSMLVVQIIGTKCPWHNWACNMGFPCMGCHSAKYPNGAPEDGAA
jgi:hypothetical protein